MKLLILISTLAVVNARPQAPDPTKPVKNDELVQIEKQEIRELKSPQSKTLLEPNEETKRALNTKEILEKIVEVNRRHGLTPKGLKTNQDYVQIPTIQRSSGAKQQSFQFPQTPFTNPIFDYLNGNSQSNDLRQGLSHQDIGKPTSYVFTTNNAQVNQEDQIPGQYIKRKVTHQQTFIMPNGGGSMNGMVPNYLDQGPTYANQVPNFANQVPTYMNQGPSYANQGVNYANQGPNYPSPSYPSSNQMPNYYGMPSYPNQMPSYPSQNQELPSVPSATQKPKNGLEGEDVKKKLENQTIENIKNIVNTQMPQPSYNPYVQNQLLPYVQVAVPYPYGMPEYPPGSSHSYRVNGPNARIPDEILLQRPGRQWQWPLAQFFPIVIKDPFQQIFNAFTSMVEYGQQQDAFCSDEQKKTDGHKSPRSGKTLNMDDAIYADDAVTNKPVTMDIEDLQMGSENSMKFTVNFKGTTDIDDRALKDFQTEPPRVNNRLPYSASLSPKDENKGIFNKHKEKEPLISNEENVKLLSKDSTGSGVFIHKLKVRKGGVAIAGPGGIATAGSGGTAIVGPNGYAYTQPDSLAIAGSGTKVIAVDPSVNFSELIASGNKTKITPRLGKVVAVGPVVYYNKGR